MADEKIIFSMVGVSKTFTNQKKVLNNIYLSFFYGAKIGIIGLLTDLSTVVDSDIAAQLKYQHPVGITNMYAEYLKKQKKCDLVICLTHLGYESESYTDVMLASLTKDVDIIVGGHSHTRLPNEVRVKNLDGKDVIIVTDWKWGMQVGKLNVEL